MFLVLTQITHRATTTGLFSSDLIVKHCLHVTKRSWLDLHFTRQQVRNKHTLKSSSKNKGWSIARCCLCCFKPGKRGCRGTCAGRWVGRRTGVVLFTKRNVAPSTIQWPFIAPRLPRSCVMSDVKADVNLDHQWHSKSLLRKTGWVTADLTAVAVHSTENILKHPGWVMRFTFRGMYRCSGLLLTVALLRFHLLALNGNSKCWVCIHEIEHTHTHTYLPPCKWLTSHRPWFDGWKKDVMLLKRPLSWACACLLGPPWNWHRGVYFESVQYRPHIQRGQEANKPVGKTPKGPRGWCHRHWWRIAAPSSDWYQQEGSNSSESL